MPYIGNTIRAADDYRLIDDISSSFNGSTTSFALQVAGSAPVPFPKSPQQVLISVNGVIQEPDPTGASGFNLVGTNIVFSSAPTNGHAFFGIIYATADYLNSGGNFPSGSLGAPSITFVGDEDTGIYRKGSGSVAFVSDSTEIANTDSNGITISSGNLIIPDSIIHNGDTNTKIRFPAADTVSTETAGSERFRVDSSGRLLIGTTSSITTDSNAHSRLQVVTTAGPNIGLARNNTTVINDNRLGVINFASNHGGTYHEIVTIRAAADADHASNSKASRLELYTTGTGNTTATERMRIDKDGHILPGTDSAYNIGSNSVRFANGYFDTLYGNGSNLTGVSSDVVDDTSPQLGGDLASNGNNIIMADNDEIVVGSSNDLIIRHIPGSRHEILGAASAQLQVRCDEVLFLSENGTEDLFRAVKNGAFKAYYDAVLALETGQTHTTITHGNNGNHAGLKIKNTNTNAGSRAELRLEAQNNASFATIFCDHVNTNLRLGYNSTGTTVAIDGNADMITGTIIPNADNSKNLGSASFRWANIFTTDLKLSNEGSQNDVDETWGNYTIQEGYEDLFLINHRTGKKFKFNLTEVA